MIFKPWDCAQPDEWLPQSLRLCWGSGDSSDSGGGNTGGGDWGSAGSYDASSFDAGGIGAWGGTAYDASSFPGGTLGGGDWGSFGTTSYGGMNAPDAIFTDVAGPNPGVTTGGGDWGSAGAFSAAGTGGGPGGAMFGAAQGAASGLWGGGDPGGGGLFGDYGGGGGGGYYGGGGGQGGGGSFGGFGTTGTLGGSNAVAAAPTGPTGSAFADSYGGGSLSGSAGPAASSGHSMGGQAAAAAASDAGPSESEAAPSEGDTSTAPSESQFGEPSEPDAAPAAPEAEPAQQDSFASRFDAVAPAQQDTFASRFDAATPDAEPSAFGPQSLDQQAAGEQGKAGQQQDSFDSRFGFDIAAPQDTFDSRFGFDTSAPAPAIEASIPAGRETDFGYGPGPQTAPPNFNQAFEAFNAPGWNPSEQTDGRTGLAEPTDWAGNPLAASTDVSVGRDFNQVFADVNGQLTNYEGAPYADMGPPTPGPDFDQSFQAFDTPTGMDLASDYATGRTTDLSSQLGLQDLTVGPGLPTGPAFGISGLNLNPLTHDDQVVNVDIVPAPPDVQPPPDQPQALPEVQPQQPQEAQPAPPQEAQPQEAQPQEAQPAPPQEAQPAPPQQVEQPPPSLIEQAQTPPAEVQPTAPPSLVDQAQSMPGTPLAFPGTPSTALPPAEVPQQPPPQGQPGEPGEPDHDEEPDTTTSVPGRPLGEPTSRTQNTPAITSRVIQEQQGKTRDRPVSEALHGILTRAAEQAGVVVRVGSGGQIATRAPGDRGRPGGWVGSHRHDDGNAADIRLEQNGRVLNYNNPTDRPIMEAFVREAARLGATGQGAGMRYMGPNTIHVGFGGTNFWRADNPGSRALRQAWNEGLHGPANRPPADIPVPTALPPQAPQETRPPADIPAPAQRGPNEFDIPVTPPVRNATVIANNIIKNATAHLNKDSGEGVFQAASVVASKTMAAAGISLAMARSLMTKSAYEGAERVGYGPSSMGWSLYKGHIDRGIEAALQGYQPAKPGEVQGPPSPATPGKRSDLPSGQQYASMSQLLGEPAPEEDLGREGDVSAREAIRPWDIMPLEQLSPMIAPPAPREPPYQPPPGPAYTPGGPGMFNPFRGNEASLQPEAPSSLLSFLQNFNPISTAEARGGRSQAGNLQTPRADPSTIQSRLSEARAPIFNELQTNQGLKNTLDLIVTGEVGSQGKAAVLGFLETAMNKVAAEASREGRAPTGRDLLNYLNDRSYFPGTWGKIESGKIKGGAVTDELLSAVAEGSNTTKGSTGNSSARSEGSRFGGNPTNVTIGKEHYGVENYAHHAAWYNALGALQDMPAVGFMPPMPPPAPAELRGLAKGGHVDKDEPVVVGEEGPETFVPDTAGTVVPHMPQPGKTGKSDNIDRWPKVPAPNFPGRYGGVEREMLRQTREAQNPIPSLMDLVDSGRLRLNAANWRAMLNDPGLIALGQSRMGTADEPAPAPAAEPPDPTSPMAQALGYGSIKRRPMQIGRQSYSQ